MGIRKNAKSELKNECFKRMNNAAFGKSMKNVRKRRGIKLVTTESRRIYLVSKLNHHTSNFYYYFQNFISHAI